MLSVDDEKETIHLYVVKEEPSKPSFLPVICAVLLLTVLVAVGVIIPYQKPEVHETLKVPAILLPIKTFTTSVKVIPTGRKTYPATQAVGTLALTNGSILSEELPKGMIFMSRDGVEIATDAAVFVPSGSATGLGYATVSAHSVIPGARGNIPALAINQVEGTALFIRNLAPFTDGRNEYTTTFITSTDRSNALNAARTWLKAQIIAGILLHPCLEVVTGEQNLQVIWHCQFVTYHIPSFMKVTNVQVFGTYLFVDVIFLARPKPFPIK